MKIRIDKNGFLIGIYTYQYIKDDWLMTDIEYKGSFFMPKLENNIWIEGITLEEKQERKKNEISALNTETKALLEPTDWALVRELDESAGWKAVPQWVKDERLNIRQAQWEKEQKIIEKYS
jgi:hypothetical protein